MYLYILSDNFIRLGYADIILAGGTESNIDELSIAGFARMKALSSNSNVAKSSRPFDRNRDGFVIGEGACIMVLEELSHALARNASIIAEIVGYGLSACAYHSTSPSPDGDGAYRSMSIALIDAGIKTEDVGYINAHATSTVLGDNIEVSAIDRLFHNISSRDMPLYVSSTKGATGHLLGAAGAVESAFACLALRDNVIPPTINLDNVDVIPKSFLHVPNYGIHYSNKMLFTSQESFTEYLDSEKNHQNEHVTKSLSETTELKHVLKNSFGFGGMNASLLFSKFKL
jgi:3-oxoacyl-[acyl-carrier-protein] synthase II